MKRTIEQCDLCGSDITELWDGVMGLRVHERWDGPGISRRTILICPHCQAKMRRMFVDESEEIK